MSFADVTEHAAHREAIDAVRVGFLVAVGLAGRTWRRRCDGRESYQLLRRSLGGVVQLGSRSLEAAGLVRTVAGRTHG